MKAVAIWSAYAGAVAAVAVWMAISGKWLAAAVNVGCVVYGILTARSAARADKTRRREVDHLAEPMRKAGRHLAMHPDDRIIMHIWRDDEQIAVLTERKTQ